MKKQIREVRLLDLLTYYLIPLLIYGAVWTAFGIFFTGRGLAVLFSALSVSLAVTFLLLRRFLIGTVLLYKAFAPLSMRSQCRFEPTCSTYMILALQKYGLVRGFIKGVARIIRCRPPNGGIDYP